MQLLVDLQGPIHICSAAFVGCGLWWKLACSDESQWHTPSAILICSACLSTILKQRCLEYYLVGCYLVEFCLGWYTGQRIAPLASNALLAPHSLCNISRRQHLLQHHCLRSTPSSLHCWCSRCCFSCWCIHSQDLHCHPAELLHRQLDNQGRMEQRKEALQQAAAGNNLDDVAAAGAVCVRLRRLRLQPQ